MTQHLSYPPTRLPPPCQHSVVSVVCPYRLKVRRVTLSPLWLTTLEATPPYMLTTAQQWTSRYSPPSPPPNVFNPLVNVYTALSCLVLASTPRGFLAVMVPCSSAQIAISLAVALTHRPPTDNAVTMFSGPLSIVPRSSFSETKTCMLLLHNAAVVPNEEVHLSVARRQSSHPCLYLRTPPNLVVTAPRKVVACSRLLARSLTLLPTVLPFLVSVTYLSGPARIHRVIVHRIYRTSTSSRRSVARNSTNISLPPTGPYLPMDTIDKTCLAPYVAHT